MLSPPRRLRRPSEACLNMLITLLWAAGAVGVGVYMLVALLRPDRF
jgi:K+-transporting ATPase KdpF subunit